MNSASYEYRKMSSRRGGGSLYTLECRLSAGIYTFPAKKTKILSTRNSSVLMMSSSEYVCFRIKVFLHKKFVVLFLSYQLYEVYDNIYRHAFERRKSALSDLEI